jgi:hypothetical protein
MQTLLQDLRYSLRQLAKNLGFTLTAVLSLALGIGATTAVFSVIYAALIHPFPYKAADRLVRITVRSRTGNEGPVFLNAPQIRLLRQSSALEDLIAMDDRSLPLTGGDFPEEVQAIFITANGFDFLGVPPVLGRGILSSDAIDGQESQPVVVLSYKFLAASFQCESRCGGADDRAESQTLQYRRCCGAAIPLAGHGCVYAAEADCESKPDVLYCSSP